MADTDFDLSADPFAAADEGGVDNAFGLAEPAAEPASMGSMGIADLDDPFAAAPADPVLEESGGDLLGFPEPAVEETPAAAEPFDSMPQEPEPVLEVQQEAKETPLSIWEAKRSEEMRTRRSEAYDAKEKQVDSAKEEIQKFYADRETRIGNIKSQNREDEQKTKAGLDDLMAYGSDWEKVTKLVDLAPKPNEKPGSSKVDRMRALLIQLKNTNKA
jgi:hypothetical protein